MKLLTLFLGTVLLTLAVAPSANAVVRPEWVVVRWAHGDCRIWHNVNNGPWGGGWRPVAFARTYPQAWAQMEALYQEAYLRIALGLRARPVSPGACRAKLLSAVFGLNSPRNPHIAAPGRCRPMA